MRVLMTLLVLCAGALLLPGDVYADDAVATDASAGESADVPEAVVEETPPTAVTAPPAEAVPAPTATTTTTTTETTVVASTEPAATPTATPPASETPSTWSGLGWQVLSYVTPVLGSLLIALVGFGIQWLRVKTADLKWQAVLDQLEDAVDTAVAAVQQTVVDALRKAAEDGTLTDAEAKTAFAQALAQVKAIIGEKGLAALRSGMDAGKDELESYLRAKIEAAVATQKAVSA